LAEAPVRVVVAENQALIRRALVGLFEDTPGLQLEAVAVDGQDALTAIAALMPDVAVINARLPQHHGQAVLRAMRARGLHSRVVFVTSDSDTGGRWLTAGGCACISTADDEESIAAVVLAAGRKAEATEGDASLTRCPLSARELQILELAANGRTSETIAAELCLSPATVRTYMHRIYDKLAAHGRAAAVAHALRHGWIA
jgi:DNA-binding NarL/FixJ family response regulator